MLTDWRDKKIAGGVRGEWTIDRAGRMAETGRFPLRSPRREVLYATQFGLAKRVLAGLPVARFRPLRIVAARAVAFTKSLLSRMSPSAVEISSEFKSQECVVFF